jgi:hypothetical protein
VVLDDLTPRVISHPRFRHRAPRMRPTPPSVSALSAFFLLRVRIPPKPSRAFPMRLACGGARFFASRSQQGRSKTLDVVQAKRAVSIIGAPFRLRFSACRSLHAGTLAALTPRTPSDSSCCLPHCVGFGQPIKGVEAAPAILRSMGLAKHIQDLDWKVASGDCSPSSVVD